MISNMNLREKEEEISHAQQNLLKRMEGREDLEISWWTTCVHVSLLQFKEG